MGNLIKRLLEQRNEMAVLNFFDLSWIAKETSDTTDSIALMRARDFLHLAPPVSARINSGDRMATIQSVLDRGQRLQSMPMFEIYLDQEEGYSTIESHDGRHRVIELSNRGFELVPVLFSILNGTVVEFSRLPLYPQVHDDDEEYPQHDQEYLDTRGSAINPNDVVVRSFRPSQLLGRSA